MFQAIPNVSFELVPNEFDTEHLGKRAANVSILNDAETLDAAYLSDEILAAASRLGFEFISLETKVPIQLPGFKLVQTALEFEASLDKVRVQSPGDNRFTVRRLQHSDWREVEHLAQYRSNSRFSSDSLISAQICNSHRLALYRDCVDRWPELARIVVSADNSAVGFHLATTRDDALLLYEIVVDPRNRIGIAAFELVSANIIWTRKNSTHTTRVCTRIYDDNTASKAFFAKLGMVNTGRKHYYYHHWA